MAEAITSYNVLDERWIRVKVKGGQIEKWSITDVLKDTNKATEILPPLFRGEEIPIYLPMTLWLLDVIIEAAYYKEDSKYASKNLKYLESFSNIDGLWTKEVAQYIEKYHDRFDILSEEFPFLQNSKLKPEIKNIDPENLSYLTWNPVAPSDNNSIFGKNRKAYIDKEGKILIQYKMNIEEFVYYLLYTASIGAPPAYTVSNEGALGRDAAIFPIITGNNLKETIIANIVPLKESSRPLTGNEKPDMPVWEMNDIHEIEEYDVSQISNNILCKTFYPGISILGAGFDEDGFVKGIVRVTKKNESNGYGLSTEISTTLAKSLPFPYAITHHKKDKEGKDSLSAKQFSPQTDTAYGLCISATKHVNDHDLCFIVNSRQIDPNLNMRIYYRELDTMHVNMLSCGVLNGHSAAVWEAFKDEDNHAKAVEYQEKYKMVNSALGNAIKHVSHLKPSIESTLMQETRPAILNAKKDLSDFMEDDFFGQFTDEISDADAVVNAIKRLGKQAVSIYDEYSKFIPDIFTVIESRNILRQSVYNIINPKKKGEKNNEG